jgi:hypothetical protein
MPVTSQCVLLSCPLVIISSANSTSSQRYGSTALIVTHPFTTNDNMLPVPSLRILKLTSRLKWECTRQFIVPPSRNQIYTSPFAICHYYFIHFIAPAVNCCHHPIGISRGTRTHWTPPGLALCLLLPSFLQTQPTHSGNK